MRIRTFFRYSLFLVVIGGLAVTAGLTLAQQVNVSATVPERPPEPLQTGTIVVSGSGYPSAAARFTVDGVAAATGTADASGSFSLTAVVDAGSHTVVISGTDATGRAGTSVTVTVNVTAGGVVTISSVFLPPTLQLNATNFAIGDTVRLTGMTVPNVTVTVAVSPHSTSISAAADGDQEYQATSDSVGAWTVAIPAAELGAGSFTAAARSERSATDVSGYSTAVGFSVEAADACAAAVPGDLNCDGRVDLIDFSILLYYWNATNPGNARADINQDEYVDITDVSILLYYWTP